MEYCFGCLGCLVCWTCPVTVFGGPISPLWASIARLCWHGFRKLTHVWSAAIPEQSNPLALRACLMDACWYVCVVFCCSCSNFPPTVFLPRPKITCLTIILFSSYDYRRCYPWPSIHRQQEACKPNYSLIGCRQGLPKICPDIHSLCWFTVFGPCFCVSLCFFTNKCFTSQAFTWQSFEQQYFFGNLLANQSLYASSPHCLYRTPLFQYECLHNTSLHTRNILDRHSKVFTQLVSTHTTNHGYL